MSAIKTVADVQRRLADIRASAGDFEIAHGMEDQLYADVLRAVARDSNDQLMRNLARAALKSKAVEFPRVCA